MVERRCVICGKTFQAQSFPALLCSEACRKKQCAAKYHKNRRRPTADRKSSRRKNKKLEDIVREAKAAGKSYGCYVYEMEGQAVVVTREKDGRKK